MLTLHRRERITRWGLLVLAVLSLCGVGIEAINLSDPTGFIVDVIVTVTVLILMALRRQGRVEALKAARAAEDAQAKMEAVLARVARFEEAVDSKLTGLADEWNVRLQLGQLKLDLHDQEQNDDGG